MNLFCRYSFLFAHIRSDSPKTSKTPDLKGHLNMCVGCLKPVGRIPKSIVVPLAFFLLKVSHLRKASGGVSLILSPRLSSRLPGAVHHAHLPPEHRQAGEDLPGHPQGQVEPGAPDPHRAPLHTGALTYS